MCNDTATTHAAQDFWIQLRAILTWITYVMHKRTSSQDKLVFSLLNDISIDYNKWNENLDQNEKIM